MGERLVALIRAYLAEQGLTISRGTLVDATIITAPRSTTHLRKERDPEMPQMQKGTQWYVDMKAHPALDRRTQLIHLVAATAAKGPDSPVWPGRLQGRRRGGAMPPTAGTAT